MDPQQDGTQVDDNNQSPDNPDSSTPVEETPEWHSILEAVPESLRGEVQPVVEQYAQTQASKYGELETQVNEYKSLQERWNDVLQYEPNVVQEAINFSNYLNQNPVEGVKQLIEALRQRDLWEDETPDISNVPAEDPDDDLDLDDPVIKKVLGKFESELTGVKDILAKLAEDREAEQRKQQEATREQQVEEFLNGLAKLEGIQFYDPKKDTHRNYVISQVSRGISGEKAVRALESEILEAAKALNAPAENAPPVIGSGSVPSNQVSPGKMTPEQRTALVAQLLANDARAAQG